MRSKLVPLAVAGDPSYHLLDVLHTQPAALFSEIDPAPVERAFRPVIGHMAEIDEYLPSSTQELAKGPPPRAPEQVARARGLDSSGAIRALTAPGI